MVRYFFILISYYLITGCASTQRSRSTVSDFFEKEAIFSDHFTGFSLYDPADKKILYEYDADHFFTPASNTKILTLFSALKILPDSIPTIQYAVANDTLMVWGLGDPTTLNPAFSNQDRVFRFISSFKLPVILCKENFTTDHFGAGWAWDDYVYYYQTEKSPFPLFGNLLHLTYSTTRNELSIYPNFVTINFKEKNDFSLYRKPEENHYDIGWSVTRKNEYLESPLHLDDSLLTLVFSTYLDSGFQICSHCPTVPGKKVFYSIPVDTVYAKMMQVSDNFIAEQLLLATAAILTDTLDSQIAIREIKKRFLPEIDGQLQWYDGSGLSRYNLFTPRAIVNILDQIYQIIGTGLIKKIFPAGGQSGTIAGWYASNNGQPYVYAKTGSLKNVHCLSGYLFTDSGKMLIFSFMHNNFTTPSNSVKMAMNKVLNHIKSNY